VEQKRLAFEVCKRESCPFIINPLQLSGLNRTRYPQQDDCRRNCFHPLHHFNLRKSNFLSITCIVSLNPSESVCMKRSLALLLIAAILSVSSIPLLPQQLVCAHASDRNDQCTQCHGDPTSHDEHSMHNAHQSHHSGHGSHTGHPGSADMSHENELSTQMPDHDRMLTEMEQECRIECGCGCHRSADGLPFLFSHHLTASVKLNHPISVSISDTEFFGVPEEHAVRVPLPPPQIA